MKFNKLIIIAISVFLIIFSAVAWKAFQRYNAPMVEISSATTFFFIPTGTNYETVLHKLSKEGLLSDSAFFRRLSELKNYQDNVKPGRYLLKDGMNANELINLLRSGKQEPVKFTFNNIRFLPKLASIAGNKLELDSAKLMDLLTNNAYLDSMGFNSQTIISIFIPNTYEFFWNTTERDFLRRMKKEYDKFWTDRRVEKAREIPLNPIEVSVLASIIQEETNKYDEMDLMAGVLINRLKRGIKLQADPTARFAHGDFSIQRVLSNYTKIESPYNTYFIVGLPPGPICMPDARSIDAVLNYRKSEYLFYCAKPDASGYHAFASTNAEHERNAAAYHNYLNRLNIKR
jgi:UPF0755 protein